MIYIVSDIHAAADAYFDLKKQVHFDKNDELYVLGDVLDGSDNHPEDALKILKDINKHKNIHLICGNHEIAHYNYYASRKSGDKLVQDTFREYLSNKLCGGLPLLNYFEKHRFEEKQAMQIIAKAETSALIKITDGSSSDRFVYLIHGTPYVYTSDMTISDWMWHTISATKFDVDLVEAVKSDPNYTINKEYVSQVTSDNLVAIVGHTPTKYLDPTFKPQAVYSENNIYDIDCGCRANSLYKKENTLCFFNVNTMTSIYLKKAGDINV